MAERRPPETSGRGSRSSRSRRQCGGAVAAVVDGREGAGGGRGSSTIGRSKGLGLGYILAEPERPGGQRGGQAGGTYGLVLGLGVWVGWWEVEFVAGFRGALG